MSSSAAASTTANNNSSSKYWNRETSQPEQYTRTKSIVKNANIICLSDANDKSNAMLFKDGSLPNGSKLLAIGSSMDDFDLDVLKNEQANVIFVSHPKVRKSK